MRPLLLTLAVLVAVSTSMTVFGATTGVLQPRGPRFRPVTTPTGTAMLVSPPFTPEEEWLQIGVGMSWLVTFAAGVTTGIMWVAKRKRTRPEEKP